jgi:carbonic anhydrase
MGRDDRNGFLRTGCSALLCLALAAAAGVVRADGHATHWGYDGASGPRAWATLSAEYAECGVGKRQSPIDLPIAAGTGTERAADATMHVFHHPHAVDVANNGHTLQVTYDDGDSLTLDGVDYQLVQYHFHAPSEHTFAGQHFPLEMHLVHRASSGALAVVGVMLESGPHNAAFDTLTSHLPTRTGASTHLERVAVDIDGLLPATRHAFRYTGSLTTPPCTEGVDWLVLRTPVAIDPAQIEGLAAVLHHNNRDVQALHGRPVRAVELNVD